MKRLTKYMEASSATWIYNFEASGPPSIGAWVFPTANTSNSTDMSVAFQSTAIVNDQLSFAGIGHVVIDLAGMTREEKTLFFSNGAIQEAQDLTMTYKLTSSGPDPTLQAPAGSSAIITDVLTVVPISGSTDLDIWGRGLKAGFPKSGIDYEHIVMMQSRTYVYETITGAFNTPTLESVKPQLGSGNPQAADSIYWYRFVLLTWNGVPAATERAFFSLPDARCVLDAESKEEADYVRMMRLKRQYDVFQLNDRDDLL